MVSQALRRTIDAWTRQLARDIGVEAALVWPLLGELPGAEGDPANLILGGPHYVRLRPREVFRAALSAGADGVAIAHTHLTDCGASEQDFAVTRRLVAAGLVVGVPLVAHVLVEPSRTLELMSGEDPREVPAPAA